MFLSHFEHTPRVNVPLFFFMDVRNVINISFTQLVLIFDRLASTYIMHILFIVPLKIDCFIQASHKMPVLRLAVTSRSKTTQFRRSDFLRPSKQPPGPVLMVIRACIGFVISKTIFLWLSQDLSCDSHKLNESLLFKKYLVLNESLKTYMYVYILLSWVIMI